MPNSEATRTEAEEQRLLARGRPAVDVLRRHGLNGEGEWYSETKAPISDSNGSVVGLVGISRDVTERVQAQEALAAGEARYRTQSQILNSILESMWEGVVVTDRSGKYLLFNRRAEALLGAPAIDGAPGDWAVAYGACVSNTNAPVVRNENPLFRAIDEEAMVEVELSLPDPSGSTRTVSVTATPFKDNSGTTLGGIAVLHDVTRQRQLEAQLVQSQKLEAIGRLAGGVAHDFNNILAVIVSYGEILLQNTPSSDQKWDDLGELLAAAHRGAGLTRQLLAFSRRQVVQPKTLNLNDVISGLRRMLGRIIGEDIELVTSPAAELGCVRADPGQIEQVILNFTVNARDAMPDGGILSIETRNISVDAAYSARNGIPEGDYVKLSVVDTGTGMDDDTLARIFEPFYTTKPNGEGTGIGLSTVYGIVLQCRGHIRVESKPEHGSAFHVYLPPLEGSPERSAEGTARRLRQSRGSESILVVEDEEAVRRVAARILRDHGYTVLEARRAADARGICAKQQGAIDLLLTDVVMPGISGPMLADELAREFPEMRRLYMSGHSARVGASKSLLEPGTPWIEKPLTPLSLLEKVREALAV